MIDEKDLYWSMGFIEGEGSFTICPKEMSSKFGKKVIRLHCQVSVALVEKDKEAIEFLQKTFGGTITFKPKEVWIKRGFLNAQNQMNWKLHSIEDCKMFCEKIKDYRFKTTKGFNFCQWKKVVYLMDLKKHLTKEGLIEILQLRDTVGDLPRNKNYKDLNYFLKIVEEMDQRNLFSENNLKIRLNKGIIQQEKTRLKWNNINSEGYKFGIDARKNKVI